MLFRHREHKQAVQGSEKKGREIKAEREIQSLHAISIKAKEKLFHVCDVLFALLLFDVVLPSPQLISRPTFPQPPPPPLPRSAFDMFSSFSLRLLNSTSQVKRILRIRQIFSLFLFSPASKSMFVTVTESSA
jgi:hypothetical protein